MIAVTKGEAIAAAARAALDDVADPCSVATGAPLGLDAMGLVKDVKVEADGRATVELRLTSPSCLMHGYFIDEIEARLLDVDGVKEVETSFDHGEEWDPTFIREDVRLDRERQLRSRVLSKPAAQRTAARPGD